MKIKQKNVCLKLRVGLCAVVIMFGLFSGSVWAHDSRKIFCINS
jgi:hypothetical protein